MSSAIDITQPPALIPTTSGVRANFLAAKTEIEALQASFAALTKSSVGLGNVDNTSDVNKPVSTAQQTALDLKANLSAAAFTGQVSVMGANVGIGTITPDLTLSVVGSMRVGASFLSESGALRVNGAVYSSSGFYIPGLTSYKLGEVYSSSTFNLKGYNGTTAVSLLNTHGAGTSGIGVNFPTGKVGIGEATPTAILHIKAGTASANTAPIKLTSGTLNTTPEAGAIEFDGTNLYFVNDAGTRRTISFT